MYKLIDAESYCNNHVLVVGGGDSAVEAATGLARQQGTVVTLSYRKNAFFRIKKKNEQRLAEMIDAGDISVEFNSTIVEIREKTVLLKSENKSNIELNNDYVFIFAGGEPPFDLLKRVGVQFGANQNMNSTAT